jgi:tetratricopeptide (TPR) repeat protein
MSDPLRTNSIDSPEPHADAERDAKIESLLLSGLDHYFASDYAQAIDVWTRALFLDRGHARARAYIDRARSALAEQQRESEELLHNGVAAFERGEIEAARQLLNAAVQRGGAHEVALAFLTRIDRINAAAPTTSGPAAAPARLPLRQAAAPSRRSSARVLTWLFIVAVIATMGYGLASWDQARALIPILRSAGEADLGPVRTVQDPLIVPRSSESAMDRARSLFASGRPYDALRAIDLIRSTDPLRADADKLKATIQRALLAHQTPPVTIESRTLAPPASAPGTAPFDPSTGSGSSRAQSRDDAAQGAPSVSREAAGKPATAGAPAVP